jgi:hypothetical protein
LIVILSNTVSDKPSSNVLQLKFAIKLILTSYLFMNHHARALGKLAKGKPKFFSPEERERRRERLARVRHLRWQKKEQPAPPQEKA